MPFNGSGTFTKAVDWAAEAGSPPVAISNLDTSEADIATGLSNCITKDGQTTVTQNIPFNNKKLTGVGAATAAGDAVTSGGTGTFTGTLTGFASNPTATFTYKVIGGVCILYGPPGVSVTGTSNSNAMTMTGLPAGATPANSWYAPSVGMNNGFEKLGMASVSSANVITFYNSTDVQFTASTFTSSGTKGLPAGWMISYPIA